MTCALEWRMTSRPSGVSGSTALTRQSWTSARERSTTRLPFSSATAAATARDTSPRRRPFCIASASTAVVPAGTRTVAPS